MAWKADQFRYFKAPFSYLMQNDLIVLILKIFKRSSRDPHTEWTNSLKYIWNEIFYHHYYFSFESALKAKSMLVIFFLISFLVPELWGSEVVKIKEKHGKISGKNKPDQIDK